MAFLKSFSLPWFAILGAHKALEHGLGIWTAILVGVIATNAGGVLIDIFSGVTPDIVKPSQQLFTASVLAGSVYTLLWQLTKGMSFFPVTLIAVAVTFVFRVFAVRDHFPSIVPSCAPPERTGAETLAASGAGPVVHR
jgi:uncharacterized membrane protein YeiH